jgi:hypothetical protein
MELPKAKGVGHMLIHSNILRSLYWLPNSCGFQPIP